MLHKIRNDEKELKMLSCFLEGGKINSPNIFYDLPKSFFANR